MPSMLKADVIDRALETFKSTIEVNRRLTREELRVYNAAKVAVKELRLYEEPGR